MLGKELFGKKEAEGPGSLLAARLVLPRLLKKLQKKLGEHLRTAKKADESKDVEKSVTDQEQRYYKCLAQVNELRDELKRLQQQHSKQAIEMKRRLDDKQSKAEDIKQAFVEFKREILKGAENSRTSKPIPAKLIASFEEAEAEKDAELEKMRLSNINRRNHLRKLEATLRQKEKLADGLHLIDFEQLKIENQTLNEKIEERNEELLKLRKKTTTTVHPIGCSLGGYTGKLALRRAPPVPKRDRPRPL